MRHFLFICAMIAIFSAALAAPDSAVSAVDREVFPAQGEHSALLEVKKPGYFSIFADSKTGTALQVVDRTMGPGPLSGSAGEKDGRIDMLMDEGKYKIKLFSSAQSSGEVRLKVIPYAEKNLPDAPLLAPGVETTGELHDREKMTFWVEVKADGNFVFDAQGRDLSRVLVWKEGNWLEGLTPSVFDEEVEEGKPFRSVFYNGKLEPGFYQVVLYGGEGPKWATDDQLHPYSVRYGFRPLSMNARFSDQCGIFGRARYLVRPGANFFMVQAADREKTSLRAVSLSSGRSPQNSDAAAEIQKDSRLPECRIDNFPADGSTPVLVTVDAKPGRKFVFQSLSAGSDFRLQVPENGDYWISTLHSGFIGDNADAGAFLVRYDPTPTVVEKDLPRLDGGHEWQRTFNILSEVTLYFDVQEAGNYSLEARGVDVQSKMEPFMTETPYGYQSPEYKKGKRSYRLSAGINTLSVAPETRGIVTLRLQKQGLLPFSGIGKDTPARASAQLTPVRLVRHGQYQLFVNRLGSDAASGMVFRSLPLHLEDALPVSLEPGESITVPVEFSEAGKFEVVPAGNALCSYTLLTGNQRADGLQKVNKGAYTLIIRNTGANSGSYHAAYTPESLLPGKPVYLPAEVRKRFPDYPVIRPGDTPAFDLGARARKVFLLSVEKAGIYEIRSTGRLKTRGTLRTRILPSMISVDANGPGRNFQLLAYLREGVYQLQVETLDRSAGRLGLEMIRRENVDGGVLSSGKTAKTELAAGESVVFSVEVPESGPYRLFSLGQNRTFPFRIEDPDGWPLRPAGDEASLEQNLVKGSYRLISLPVDVETRRQYRLEPIVTLPVLTGKGPLELKLNEAFQNVWMEKESAGKRQPDVYRFAIPAPMEVGIAFSPSMEGELFQLQDGKAARKIRGIREDRPFRETLADGNYQLELRAIRKDNYLDYRVELSSPVLAPGMTFQVNAPAVMPVSLKSDSLTEIWSTGASDVSAKLLASDGRTLAFSDDAWQDWNFRVSVPLSAGRYQLRVNPRGQDGAQTTVLMRTLEEIPGGKLEISPAKPFDLGGKIMRFRLPESAGLYRLKIRANSPVAAAFSGIDQQEGARREGRNLDICFRLPSGTPTSLAIWSLSHLDERLTLALEAVPVAEASLDALRNGISIQASGGIAVVAVPCPAPGTWRVDAASESEGAILDRFQAAFTPETGGLALLSETEDRDIGAGKGKLTLMWETDGPVRLTMRRKEVPAGPEWTSSALLQPGKNTGFRFQAESATLFTIRSQGKTGPALCGFTDRPAPANLLLPNGTAVSPVISVSGNGAFAASLSGSGAEGAVWNARSDHSPCEVTWTAGRYPLPEALPLDGFQSGSLETTNIVLYRLPGGSKRIDTALSAGTAVIAWKGEAVTEVFHADDAPRSVRFSSEAERLAVIRYREGAGNYQIGFMKEQDGQKPESLRCHESQYSRGTTEGFTVPEAGNALSRNRMLGFTNCIRLTLVQHDGSVRVAAGNGVLPIDGASGRVFAEWDAGYGKIWLESGADMLEGRWGSAIPMLSGAKVNQAFPTGPEGGWVDFETADWSAVRFNADGPFVCAVWKDGKFQNVFENVREYSKTCIMKPGKYRLGVRGWKNGGKPMNLSAGMLRLPIVELKDWKGPEVILAQGECRVYAIELPEERKIGVMADSPDDSVTCSLYDQENRLLQTGFAIFRNLPKGRYTLQFEMTGNAQAVSFRPLVPGLVNADREILEEKEKELLKNNGFQEGAR